MRYTQRGSIPGFRLKKLLVAMSGVLLSASPAVGIAAEDDPITLEEIVVTGTLLRSATPVGSNEITLGAEAILETGAMSANELLGSIPQVSNLFNTTPSSRLDVAQNQIQVVRPNLRNLSPETGSSSSTLVLFNGHRIAGVGITQSSVDPDLIPTGAIERVDVVTDGGSATYGADAVGGVINFITRKTYDGVKLDVRHGIADDYDTSDINLTAGTEWESGGIYVSVMHQENDAIYGRDRDWIRNVDWSDPDLTPTSLQCSPGNVTLPGAFDFSTFTFGPSKTFAYPNLTTEGVNPCELSADATSVPEAERKGLFIGFTQELTDSLTLDTRAFYGGRESRSFSPQRGQVSVTPNQAFYVPIPSNPTATQTVSFNLADVAGLKSAPRGTEFDEWGLNAELTADLNGNWQMRTLLNYSESESEYYIVGLNNTALSAAGSASDPALAYNFYEPNSAPNLAVLSQVLNQENAGEGTNSLVNARVIFDGTLFTMSGGDVLLAVGAEYLDDSFEQRVSLDGARGAVASLPFDKYDRDVQSYFSELQIPLVGEGNNMPGVHSITLAGSVRYDDFSDFGDTTNYKIGLVYEPVEWLALRGNVSTSFNAPSPVDQLGAQRNTINFFPFNAFVRPGDTPNVNGTVAIQGSMPNLQPQEAETTSFGFDIVAPPFAEGLNVSVNYYDVEFTDRLDIPTPNAGIFANFPDNIQTDINGLDAATLLGFGALAPGGVDYINNVVLANNLPVYEAVLFLVGNYGELNVKGLDFVANYIWDTNVGSFNAGISGNYQLDRKSKVSATADEIDLLEFDSGRYQAQAMIGGQIGKVRAQATWKYSDGYDVQRSAGLPQDSVDSFDTVDLFFSYDASEFTSSLESLRLTLNIANAFDQDPPVFRGLADQDNGYANGFTIGRLITFGVSTEF